MAVYKITGHNSQDSIPGAFNAEFVGTLKEAMEYANVRGSIVDVVSIYNAKGMRLAVKEWPEVEWDLSWAGLCTLLDEHYHAQGPISESRIEG